MTRDEVKIGAKVVSTILTMDYPFTPLPVGTTGVIVDIGEDFCSIKLDVHNKELNAWDNEVQVHFDEEQSGSASFLDHWKVC